MSDVPYTIDESVPLVPEHTVPLSSVRAPEGLLSWIASVDHKQIGIMYILMGVLFFLIAGLEALLVRTQLVVPRNHVLSPEVYNQMFTMHGTTMIFFAAMPLLIGFGNYLVPLMIGARDMAFPRLNAFGFWVTFFAGLILYFSFIAGGAPDGGWFAYPPYTEKVFNLTHGMDYWAISLFVAGIGSISAAINFIVTIVTLRAPGMTWRRLPAFPWLMMFTSFLILFAIPGLNVSVIQLWMDRNLGTHFYDAIAGGSSLLYQHYFWSFGHPEVYILVLPAFGIMSEVLPVFARKPLFGFAFVIGSSIAISFYSFAVWGHHMWAAGMGFWMDIAFAVGTFLIAVPTGVKIFNWIATIWGGSIRFTVAMMFAISFLVDFVMGGVTGVQFGVVPFDRQVTDTYYVVAHFHYVLLGGTITALYAGIYYWYPKVTGRLMSERLGVWHFILATAGLHMTFLIQHVLGWIGMPRRTWTYDNLPGYGWMNMLSTVGAFVTAAGALVLVYNLVWSYRHGKVAGDNPWDANTLEWATTSPPPVHNFEVVPPVRSRRPVWDLNHPERADYLVTAKKGH